MENIFLAGLSKFMDNLNYKLKSIIKFSALRNLRYNLASTCKQTNNYEEY